MSVNLCRIFFMPRPPKPGGVTIEPRTFTKHPAKFGTTSSRLEPGPIGSAQHGAAELQHIVFNTVREFLADNGQSLKTFCATTALPDGITYERQYRLSNGTQMMGLTDLVFWATHIPAMNTIIHATLGDVVDSANATPN